MRLKDAETAATTTCLDLMQEPSLPAATRYVLIMIKLHTKASQYRMSTVCLSRCPGLVKMVHDTQ